MPNTNTITFSPRERQILRLLCLGYATRHIAAELEITEAIVNGHRTRMFEKAGLVNREQFVRYAFQHEEAWIKGGQCARGLHEPECMCWFCSGARRLAT